MDNGAHARFAVRDRSYTALLKKDIHQLAIDIGFSGQKLAEIDLVVAEMASNLVKHAGGGELLVKLYLDGTVRGIELLSIDSGPGITDVQRMLEDGISTTNTLGHGLGSMKRLSDSFQIYSQKNWGTLVLARKFLASPAPHAKPMPAEIRALVVPKSGESVSGDGVYWTIRRDGLELMLGDGLGHGPDAHQAIVAAILAFRQMESPVMADRLRLMHQAVRKTRGLVATAVRFDFKTRVWQICGVGNIATRIQHPLAGKSHLAYNGIVGMNLPTTMKDHAVPYEPGQVLIMCSDGIRSRWESGRYPAILKNDLSLLTAAIYKDFNRGTDDTSVLACRINRGL